MSEIELRTQSGESVGRVALDDRVFGAQVNVPVMHQVVVAQLAAARAGTHATKTRGEVSGGGKKPWRQKGTGRARQGSIRAPHWTGGGTVFGPQPRDYDKKVPKKMRALALRSALSARAKDGRIIVVDRWEFPAPKTKDAQKALTTLGADGKVLVVLETLEEATVKSFRNITGVHVLEASQLNVYDILNADWVVFTKAAVEQANARGEANGRRRATAAATAEGGES